MTDGTQVETDLERASTLLTSGDSTGAFDALTAAWRTLRAAEIAELCEALSARAKAPVPGKTKADQLLAWDHQFRERTPLGLGPLLANFEEATKNGLPRFVFPRAESLATVEDDPRIAPVMLRVIAKLEGGSKWEKVARRYFRALEASRDPRAIAGLAQLLADNGKALATHPASGLRQITLSHGSEVLGKLRLHYPNGVPPLPESLVPRICALHDQIANHDVRIEKRVAAPALFAKVYADPEDEALRLVLADTLVERGDPRGEFIVLQVRRANGESTAKTVARERALFKEHGRAFLGPLAAIVPLKTAVFERGFLHACVAAATNNTMAIHFQHPEWATVQRIRFRGAQRITETMTELRDAGPLGDVALKQLVARGHPKIERLELETKLSDDLAECTTLPALRDVSLNIDANGAKPLWATPWGPKLKRLGGVVGATPAAWIDVLIERTHLEELALKMYGCKATIARTDDGFAVKLILEWRGPLVDAPSHLVQTVDQWLDRFASPHVRSLHVELTQKIPFRVSDQTMLVRRTEQYVNLREAKLPWES